MKLNTEIIPPTLIQKFADNGAHSHWELIDTDTGRLLWSEDVALPGTDRQICEHGGFPFSTNHMCRHYDQCITGVRSPKVKECCIDWLTRLKKEGRIKI